MWKLFLLPIAVTASSAAFAELQQTEPTHVCALLADQGLKGRKWIDYGDGTSGCASDYKDIGAGAPLANNIAYYVMGEGSVAGEVKLVVNFNQPSRPGPGIQALGKAAEALAPKVLGGKITGEVRKAIVKGVPTTASVGSGTVEVIRQEWPTGKGYELQVIMK